MENLLNCALNGNLTFNTTTANSNDLVNRGTCWDYWQNIYYPQYIIPSYPVYIQERATDKGKQAYEIIKSLQDKKLLDLKTVKDFIDAMDTLIKIL